MGVMRLIHVDRPEAVREEIRNTLVEIGMIYEICSGWSELEARMEGDPCDLIVVAETLPEGSGFELIRRLNGTAWAHIPVIVLISEDNRKNRKNVFSVGAVDYLIREEVTPESLRRYISALTAEDPLMADLRKMPVAVMDDSRSDVNIIGRMFDFLRICDVDFFADPDTLLKARGEYALYLIDMYGAGRSLEDLVSSIRKRVPDSRILVLSTDDQYKKISHVLMTGADDFILKPFDFSIFVARLKNNARTYALTQHLIVARS